MTNRFHQVVSALASAVMLAPAVAQSAPVTKRQKVVVIGASVSAGFEDPTSKQADGSVNRSFKLDMVLKKVWPRKVARIYNVANMMMFRDPGAAGRQQLKVVVGLKPALVLGIDFPFWFGYGFAAAGKPGAVNQRRLANQRQCFRLLDQLDCPILLGDYPDMRGASTKMLPRYMIPNPPTVEALNKALLAYATKRPRVQLVSLARFVKRAVTGSQTYAYGSKQLVFPKNYLLQSDRLHATRLGTVVLTTHLLPILPRLLTARHPLLNHQADLRSLVAAMGLREELPQKQ